MLFDLDDLKKINDKYGHLTGSHAIKRLGNALRSNSRTIDTPARYGGDEFAVILPEIGEEAAQGVAERICARLANDGQLPQLPSAWEYPFIPNDGTTIEKFSAPPTGPSTG